MKLVKILLGLTTMIVVMFACRKERSLESGLLPEEDKGSWEFQDGSLMYKGEMDSAHTQIDSDFTTISMSGYDTAGTGHILLAISRQEIGVGIYNGAQISFQYQESESILYQNVPNQPDQFSLTITAIDSQFISGTFTGVVEDGLGNPKTITNGKFRAARSAIAGPAEPAGSGQLTVWSKQLCSDNSGINISVGGQTGSIATASSQEPVCGGADNTTFDLPAGTYTLYAVCGTDSVSYNVTIVANTCSTLEIEMTVPPLPGDWLPINLGSYWDYQDLQNPANNNRITAENTVEIDSRVYTTFSTSLGDSMLYRKDGSTYYQYKTLNFQSNISDPPTIEMEILHDDYPVGQSWSTPAIPLTITGITIQVKLVSAITTRDFTEDFFGIPYANLIEVKTTLLISLDGGATFDDSGTSYSTIFAKGIGIIYYDDLNQNIQWGLKDYQLAP